VVTWPRVVFVAGSVALAYIGSGLPSHDWTSLVAVALPAAGILVLSLTRPVPADVPTDRSPRVRRAVLAWGLLIVAALAWEAWAFFGQPAWNVSNPAHPTVSGLVDPLLEYRAVRFAGWLAWLWVGRKLVGR
jgi:hypothetical protein